MIWADILLEFAVIIAACKNSALKMELLLEYEDTVGPKMALVVRISNGFKGNV